jgi:hypothetical protein
MGHLSHFEGGQIVGGRLAEASVTKIVTFLGVLRATVCKVMSAYTNHGKAISAKKSSGRKLTWTEGDRCALRRIFSKNHRIAAAQPNWILILKTLIPQ